MFYRNNHWTSGIINKIYKPITLHNTITNTTILDLAAIQKILKKFRPVSNRSNIPQYYNMFDKIINLESNNEQTIA